jgi:hypothetical protein
LERPVRRGWCTREKAGVPWTGRCVEEETLEHSNQNPRGSLKRTVEEARALATAAKNTQEREDCWEKPVTSNDPPAGGPPGQPAANCAARNPLLR